MVHSLEMVPVPGYTPMVGAIVAMLEHTRGSTLAAVAGLGLSELDYQHDGAANPIGALLAHVATIEWGYAVATLGGPPPAAEDWATWGPLFQLGPAAWAAARGRPLEAHVQRLQEVRERTLAGLRGVDDAWLTQRATLPWLRAPVTHLWAWYHVMEDELNHRGQIRWLRARLPSAEGRAAPAPGTTPNVA
jgi:uncharacterized damage-inducible protein DinB